MTDEQISALIVALNNLKSESTAGAITPNRLGALLLQMLTCSTDEITRAKSAETNIATNAASDTGAVLDGIEFEDTTGSGSEADTLSLTMKKVTGSDEEEEVQTIAQISLECATTSKAGLMSASDKSKLYETLVITASDNRGAMKLDKTYEEIANHSGDMILDYYGYGFYRLSKKASGVFEFFNIDYSSREVRVVIIDTINESISEDRFTISEEVLE